MSKLAAILALCVAAPALAQPTTMVYQGTLTDLGGDPVTASVSLTFKVFGQEIGGSQLWTETLDADVEDGFFSVVLGETQALVESLFPANADRWLEISVEGTALTPRQPLGSAPWALVCGDAQTVAGGMTPLTSVTSPGGTLTAGGTGGNRTLDVDYSVMGSCGDPTNDKVVGIDSSGAVQCMPDLQGPGVPGDITAVFPGVGMNFASGGSSGDVTLDLEVPVTPFNGGTGLLGSGGGGLTYLRSDAFGGWVEDLVDGNSVYQGSIALDKLAGSGCAPGQVPTFDGLSWVCGGATAAIQQSTQGGFGTLVGQGVDALMYSTMVAFPADGMALLMAEANFSASDADKWLSCHLAEDGVALVSYYWDAGDIDGWYDNTQSHSESKAVTAGFHTYELFCNWNSSGSLSDVGFGYPQIVVAFFPASL